MDRPLRADRFFGASTGMSGMLLFSTSSFDTGFGQSARPLSQDPVELMDH